MTILEPPKAKKVKVDGRDMVTTDDRGTYGFRFAEKLETGEIREIGVMPEQIIPVNGGVTIRGNPGVTIYSPIKDEFDYNRLDKMIQEAQK